MDRQSHSILRLGRSCCVRSGPAAAGAAAAVGERDKDISKKMSQKAASPYKRGYTKKRGQTNYLLPHIYGD